MYKNNILPIDVYLNSLLIESLKTARQKYSSKIEDKIFKDLIDIDFTATKKYVEALCFFYMDGATLDELIDNIKNYDKLISKNVIKQKDINQFKSYMDFKSVIDEFYQDREKETEKLKKIGVEFLINTPELIVLSPTTYQASTIWGKGTKWCISFEHYTKHWDSYERMLVKHYFIINYSKPVTDFEHKIAVSVYQNGKIETRNSNDKVISQSVVKKLGLNYNMFKPMNIEGNQFLDKIIKGSYTVDKNNVVNVKGDVDLHEKYLKEIPIKFGTVTGNFDISKNDDITSLENAPTEVGGDFICTLDTKIIFDEDDVRKVCNVKGKIII